MEYLEKALQMNPLHEQARIMLNDMKSKRRVRKVTDYPDKPKRPELAGLGTRFIAQFLDNLLLAIVALIFIPIYSIVDPPPVASEFLTPDAFEAAQGEWLVPFQIIFIIFLWFYYTCFFTMNDGKTPAKALLGIQIVSKKGNKLTLWDALGRNIFGYAISGAIFGLGYFWAIFDKQNQAWHDKIVGTIVIKTR